MNVPTDGLRSLAACTSCAGTGEMPACIVDDGPSGARRVIIECRRCRGSGEIELVRFEMAAACERLHNARVAARVSMADLHRETGITPAEWSEYEGGDPVDDRIRVWIIAHAVERGWFR